MYPDIPEVAVSFTMSRKQYETYLSWREKLPAYKFEDRPQYCFSFTPIGITMYITVTRSDGYILNLC